MPATGASSASQRPSDPARGSVGSAGAAVSEDRVVLLAARDAAGLVAEIDRLDLDALASGGSAIGSGPVRMAIGAPTARKLGTARKVAERGRAWRGRGDLWFSPDGLIASGGRIAFVYPGVESGFDPGTADLARHLGLDVPDFEAASDLKHQTYAIIAAARVLREALATIGLDAGLLAGNSIGEWNALIAAEAVPASAIDGFIDSLTSFDLVLPDVVYAAAGCAVEVAQQALEGLDEIWVSHDNCPHQTVLCGVAESVRVARERLRGQRVLSEELPFRSGFHSPLFQPYLAPFEREIARVPLQSPKRDVWSATTCAPYPDDADAIRSLITRAFVEPVLFRPLTEKLYEEGVRAFVQIGLGSLTAFVDDTLSGRDHLAVAAASPKLGGVEQMRRVAASLWAEGADLQLGSLFDGDPASLSPPARSGSEPVAAKAAVAAVAKSETASSAPAAPTPVSSRIGSGRSEKKSAVVARPRSGRPDRGAHRGADRSAAVGRAVTARRAAVVREFEGLLGDIESASREVLEVFERAPVGGKVGSAATARRAAGAAPSSTVAPSLGERKATYDRHLSIEDYPEFMDHCLYRQPADWPNPSDCFPISPMTGTIEMIFAAARELVPELLVVGLEGFRNFRWLDVAPPVDITIQARFDGVDRVRVSVDGYARGTVVMAQGYEVAPAPSAEPLADAAPCEIDAVALYEERWMFHGPDYRGVVEMGLVSDGGMDGELETLPALGALLDAAGQLMGYWILVGLEKDRLILPTAVGRITFYGPPPEVGSRLSCTVRIREVRTEDVRADLEVVRDGKVWARLEDWTDMRFGSDQVVMESARNPESETLADPGERPYTLVRERWSNAAFRELMARRYLGQEERDEYFALNPNAQRQWLLGRMAVKDAVRTWLWEHGYGSMFPIEIRVTNDDDGRPTVSGPFSEDLRVSISHKDAMGVAMVREGADLGIDLETVAPRKDRFAEIVATEAERALVENDPEGIALTRLWTIKEAVAKSRGTGLGGRPKDFVVEEIDGERARVGEVWVRTHQEEDTIVSWTE